MTGIHLLSISLDTNLFDQTSDVFARQQEYSQYFSHTTILVLNTGLKTHHLPLMTDRLDITPVNAFSRLNLIPKAISLAIKIHQQHPFQLITAQDPLVSGYIGKKLKDSLSIPLNVQVHTDIFNPSWRKQSLTNRILFSLVRPNLLSANSIRVVSETLKKALLIDLKLMTFHSGLNVFVAPVRVDLDQFWKLAHYHQECTRFISVGRLAPEKNYPLLIDAFAQIVKDHPQAKLTIVGDGPEKDTLASQIVNYGLNDKVFLVGKKTSAEIATLLHQHDVFVLTSNYEGWGMVYVEAFAAGLPVISTPVSSVGELLQPDTNCLIGVSASDIAFRMHYLVSHPEEAYRMGKNGQMWVKQNLESKVLVQNWIHGLINTIPTQSI